ncbi:hypothetical protein Ancab_034631 [Ancistrocladus abbreviatus]
MSSFQWTDGVTPLLLTEKFILPDHKRPQLSNVSHLASIPIIDMSSNNVVLVQEIARACEEYGFFQIINHGVPIDLCNNVLNAITAFFHMPPEEKANHFTMDPTKETRVFKYYLKDQGVKEEVSMWSEIFCHCWHASHNFSDHLPDNPPEYREEVVKYAKEIGALMSHLLMLMSRGLGLEDDCLERRMGENPYRKAQANYYPPCPDPELTLGLNVHTDICALTVVLQTEQVQGLQVIKDEKWVPVDPIPNAFVINVGDQLQVLSNGRYKSVHHRAVTNKDKTRVSMVMFYRPNMDTIIGPMEDLIDDQHPPFYRSYRFSEFMEEFHRQEGTRRRVKEAFELHN